MESVKAQQHIAIEESDEAKQLMAIGESDEAQQLKAMEKSEEAKQHDLQLRHLDKAFLAPAPPDASQTNSALWNLRHN